MVPLDRTFQTVLSKGTILFNCNCLSNKDFKIIEISSLVILKKIQP
ncbi:MAG: hypothetical protein K0Q97_2484 [Bacillota bacterium]|nr:hypothetical protein [Bacillota bacterium]